MKIGISLSMVQGRGGQVIIQPPVASNVTISGTLAAGQILTGEYEYSGSRPESGTTYQWYSSTDDSGTGAAPIAGATALTLELTPAETLLFIAFEVTPSDGVLIGEPVLSAYQGPVV